jgi:hypothetical protein
MDVCVPILLGWSDETLMHYDRPQLVLHSMLASRVLFSLRENDQQMDGTTALQMSTLHPAQYNYRHSTSLGLD